MGDDCEGCRKREEVSYWKIFQSIHFIQILSGCSYDQELAIPKSFADNFREKPSVAYVKGPCGVIWKIGLIAREDTLFFKLGWKEFVRDHYLKQNDILVFKYIGSSGFEVLLFDSTSLCEKQSSYFIKKCDHQVADSGCKSKGSFSDSSSERLEDTDESSHEVVSYGPKKPRNHTIQTSRSVGQRPRVKRTFQGRNKSLTNRIGTYAPQLASHLRRVTEEGKKKALQMANAASLEDCFTVVMRPSHVDRAFYMSIPTKWARAHLSQKSQDVELRLKEKTWQARYFHRDTGGGGLTGGWKNFVLDNSLEEFDVCLFNLINGTEYPIIMDVSIFRAVEEVTAASQVLSTTPKGRRTTRYQSRE